MNEIIDFQAGLDESVGANQSLAETTARLTRLNQILLEEKRKMEMIIGALKVEMEAKLAELAKLTKVNADLLKAAAAA